MSDSSLQELVSTAADEVARGGSVLVLLPMPQPDDLDFDERPDLASQWITELRDQGLSGSSVCQVWSTADAAVAAEGQQKPKILIGFLQPFTSQAGQVMISQTSPTLTVEDVLPFDAGKVLTHVSRRIRRTNDGRIEEVELSDPGADKPTLDLQWALRADARALVARMKAQREAADMKMAGYRRLAQRAASMSAAAARAATEVEPPSEQLPILPHSLREPAPPVGSRPEIFHEQKFFELPSDEKAARNEALDLVGIYGGDGSDWTRPRLLQALLALGSSEPFDSNQETSATLSDSDDRRRWEAVEALTALPSDGRLTCLSKTVQESLGRRTTYVLVRNNAAEIDYVTNHLRDEGVDVWTDPTNLASDHEILSRTPRPGVTVLTPHTMKGIELADGATVICLTEQSERVHLALAARLRSGQLITLREDYGPNPDGHP